MATIEKLTYEGIVLRLAQTKEADAMVNALGPNGLFSFYARGVGKWTSKNKGAVQTLSHAHFSLILSTSGSLTLSEAKPIESFLPAQADLGALSVFSFLSELSVKLIQQGEGEAMYPWLLKTLQSIQSGFDPLTAGLIYFAHLLVDFGIGLDVDQCVVCHKKTSITSLSFVDGGFLCKEHAEEEGAILCSARKLKIIRYLFRVPLESLTKVSFEKEETIPLYRELSDYVSNLTGVRLQSLSLLEKI